MRRTHDFDERYGVIQSRDPRFDGQFVTAVRSTGIYCRPSCPARTPKPANVSFFATSAAAHEAGYRACKRCLPEAAPGSPEWDLRGDTTARAMRLIADGVVEREGVPGLARRLGYSPRHLTRLLTAELGAGPLALSRAHRAHTARMLLVGTDLPAADVAFSAGFSSIRQFNETVREVFGMPPLELRARRRRARAAPRRPGAIDLVLPHRGPFDAEGLFAWMAARAVSGVESATADVVRPHAAPGRRSGVVRAAPRRGRAGVRLRARLTHLGDLSTLVTRARRLFDLDADPLAVDDALARHPELAPLVARGARHPRAGRRRPARDAHPRDGRPADHGRRRRARALTALADALGEPVDDRRGRTRRATETRLFPTMAAIAERGHEVLRGPGGAHARDHRRRRRARRRHARPRPRRRRRRSARGAAGDARHRPVDGRLRAHARDRRHRRVPARRRRGARRRRRRRASRRSRGARAWAARTAPWRSYLTAHLWRAVPPRPAGDPAPLTARSSDQPSETPHPSLRHTSAPPVPTTGHRGGPQ